MQNITPKKQEIPCDEKKTIKKSTKIHSVQRKYPIQFLCVQAIIQAEVGQYVQITLFDKDEASDDEPLGR